MKYIITPPSGIQSIDIRYEDGVVYSENNIIIGEWTIYKEIVTRPITSIYKYDFSSYIEVVISDKLGETRTKRWYYYKSDPEVETLSDDCWDFSEGALKIFLSRYKAFQYGSWKEYDAYKNVERIKEVISRNDSPLNIIEGIKEILK